MLSCSIWCSAPSFWMGGGLESRCVGRVCGADGAVHGTASSWHFKLFHEEDARSYNPQNIKVGCQYEESAEAFKVTGVRSFYPHVISATYFLLSEVRNRPQGIWNYDQSTENDQAFQMCVSFEKKAAEFNTCANSLKNKSLPEGSKQEAERA